MTKFIRAIVASAALTGMGLAIFTGAAQAAVGQTALGKCYDLVTAACNKKPDHAVNPCLNSGFDQSDEEHGASIEFACGRVQGEFGLRVFQHQFTRAQFRSCR